MLMEVVHILVSEEAILSAENSGKHLALPDLLAGREGGAAPYPRALPPLLSIGPSFHLARPRPTSRWEEVAAASP